MAGHHRDGGKAAQETYIKDTMEPGDSRGNNYVSDHNLQRYLDRHYPGFRREYHDMLSDYGGFCTGFLEDQANDSDRRAPPYISQVLDDPVRPQGRRNIVVVNDRYAACQQEIYKKGFLAACFNSHNPAPHMLPFLAQYMTSYSDISTGCPLAMTHPIALLLGAPTTAAPLREKYLPQLLRRDGKTPIGGTWATERHSGSDVPGTATTAIKHDDGTYRLNGHQWFASATGFERWLTVKTAQTPEGLGLFLVPSHLDEDWSKDILAEPNRVDIEYLKDKHGTKGLATAEVTLNDTVSYMVADGQGGLRTMMEALGCSRVHNAMGAAGVMRRAYIEALSWAAERTTFGARIITRPMIQDDLLDLKTEWLGGSALAFEAARAFDQAQHDPNAKIWLRMATALAKFRTADQALDCTATAMEIIGGLGYTKDHAIERIQRDAMVLRVWEGPKHIQARELTALLHRGGAAAFMQRLGEITDDVAVAGMETEARHLADLQDKVGYSLQRLAASPDSAVTAGLRFLQDMSAILTYGLLCEEAAAERALCNDMTKQLVAGRFYDRHCRHYEGTSLVQDPLQEHFDAVSCGRIIPVVPPGSLPRP